MAISERLDPVPEYGGLHDPTESNTVSTLPKHQSSPSAAARSISRAIGLPNLIIIGASRSGTTSIHYALGEHPQIYMSPSKETNFFSYYCSGGQTPRCVRKEEIQSAENRSIKSLEEYRRLFRGVTDELIVGESSPSYLLTEGVPEAIRCLMPEAKILVVLRQPIEKAYSHFTRKCQIGLYAFNSDFAAALEQDETRIESQGRGTSFLSYARYYDYLKRYYDTFERAQIKVCLFDELETNPQDFYLDLLRFLGVEDNFRLASVAKLNQSGQTNRSSMEKLLTFAMPFRHLLRKNLPPALASKLWHHWHKMQAARIEKVPALSPDLRRELTERYFNEELSRLEDLVGRDLSHWRI